MVDQVPMLTAHLNNGDKLILNPGVIVDQAGHRFPVDCCVERIRELVADKMSLRGHLNGIWPNPSQDE